MAAKRKTSNKSKKTLPKKTKKMVQTHAMEEGSKFEPTSLDQIWGDTGSAKYGTLEELKYISQIKAMNKSDLHSHAIKLGILPVENRELLTNRLLREFKKHTLSYQKPKQSGTRPQEISNEIKSILAQGR